MAELTTALDEHPLEEITRSVLVDVGRRPDLPDVPLPADDTPTEDVDENADA